MTAEEMLAQNPGSSSISMPMVHPSWTASDTFRYWQEKDKNTNDLIAAYEQGFKPENYLDIMEMRAKDGDADAIEWLANKYATEDSEKTAREWTAQREDTAYQRMIKDLTAAGVSPYILSGSSPVSSSSTGKTYSGSSMTSRANNKRTADANELRSILSLIGVFITASALALR